MAQTIKLRRSATPGNVPDPSVLALGEVAINTYDGKMYIKKNVQGTESIVEITGGGSGAGSSEDSWKSYSYTATAGQTLISGEDNNSQELRYSVGDLEVFLNGILLDPEVDYTALSGSDITFTQALALDDLVQINTITGVIGTGDILVNTFTGTGSQTNFTLTSEPGNEDNTFVYIDGVYQEKAGYTVTGTNLVFTEAPYTDASIEIMIGSRNVSITEVNDFSISGDFIATGSVTGASASITGTAAVGSLTTGSIDSTGIISTDTTVNAADANLTGNLETSTMTMGGATFSWNSNDGTVDIAYDGVTLQVGQEEHFYAKATETINNGDVVMFAGAQGDHVLVAKADHTSVGFKPEYIIGVATNTIANNAFGYVTSFGKVRNINTSGYNEGDILYFDPTIPGGLTTTRPTPPNHIIQLAAVLKSHQEEGTLLVRLTHFSDTDEVEEGSTNLYYTDGRVENYLTTNNYATESYVGEQIGLAVDDLVDAAPGSLDTLNELAAALNDDENFAATVNNSISANTTKIENAKAEAVAFAIALG
jgi:hypothetical protein